MPIPIEPDPLIVQVIRSFKAGLLNQERVQMVEMTRKWLEIEARLNFLIEDLANDVEKRIAAGKPPKVSQIINMERYKELVSQTRTELRTYEEYSESLIARKQLEWGRLGIINATESIYASFETFGVISTAFNILPVSAIEFMVGATADGSPLRSLLKQINPDAIEGLTNALIEGITLGRNPRETARLMRNGFGLGLNRAMVIARTEQLRAYRESSRFQYQASGLIQKYKRIATHDGRVCAGCLFAEGEIYDVEGSMPEHPQGRCAEIPILVGLPAPEWDSGIPWFERQDESYQRTILGPTRYQMWQEGEIQLPDVIKRSYDPVWGGAINPKPVYELKGFGTYEEFLEYNRQAKQEIIA